VNKLLKLSHQAAELVRQGKKTSTWRLNDDKDLRVNDRIAFIDKVSSGDESSWGEFGDTIITSIVEKRFGDLTAVNFEGSEDYATNDDMIKAFQRYYGEKIDYNAPVKIIHFDPLIPDTKSAENIGLPKEVKIYTDGGSRGNPGLSAGGFAILDMANNVVRKSGKYLGITTNNQAEYHSLKGGIEAARDMGVKRIHVFMDSLLVINQMKGIYKIKNRDLLPIHQAIKQIVSGFEEVEFTHIPRELNKLADSIVNETLDNLK